MQKTTVVDMNGHTHVYFDDTYSMKHNTDGPALILKDGTKVWYKYGKIHRDDGPAIVDATGWMKWYLNGQPLSYDEFVKVVNQNNVATH